MLDGSARLIASGLSAGYGGAPVLDGLSLAIAAGTFTALVGANGSGKSTLLRALARMLPLRSGRITLDDRPLGSFGSKEFARRVGLLAQSPTVPEGLTVEELVRQGRYPYRSLLGRWSADDEEACSDALQLAGMADLARRSVDTLSGGQRQRAWIAMTLAQQTEILLLDEPTTYLDMAHQVEVLGLLEMLVREKGKAVVAVLHDLNQAARHADRIAVLKQGRLIANGAPDEAMTPENVRDAFGVTVTVLADPYTGKAMCVPAPVLRHAGN